MDKKTPVNAPNQRIFVFTIYNPFFASRTEFMQANLCRELQSPLRVWLELNSNIDVSCRELVALPCKARDSQALGDFCALFGEGGDKAAGVELG